jgi:hypothetical protein
MIYSSLEAPEEEKPMVVPGTGRSKRILLSVMVLCVLANAYCKGDVKLPPAMAKWHVISPFPDGSVKKTCANYTLDAWVVSMEKDQIVLSKRYLNMSQPHDLPFQIEPGSAEHGLFGERCAHQVDNGYLVGFNAGEFGGAIWWFSKDGKNRSLLMRENIKGFVQTKNSVLGIFGLAHMTISRGGILKLEKDSLGKWSAKMMAELGAAPQAFIEEKNGSILIVTTNSLVRFYPDKKYPERRQEILHKAKSSWGILYPTSIVVDSAGVVYIGMRYAIARLTPEKEGYKEEWLVPKLCARMEIVRGTIGCRCINPK